MTSWPRGAGSRKKPSCETSSFEGIAEDYVAWYSTPYGSYAHELEKELIFRFLGAHEDKKIVDIGCGPGFYTEILSRHCWVVGVDSSKDMLRMARKRGAARYVLASAEALPFKEGVFDLALSVLALCFIGDHGNALADMKRVVRREGRVIAAVLNKWSVYGVQKRIASKFRRSIYSRARFFDVLEIKRMGARKWDSVLFALPWMPSAMLRLFRRFESPLSRLFKPFGAFLVFELGTRS